MNMHRMHDIGSPRDMNIMIISDAAHIAAATHIHYHDIIF